MIATEELKLNLGGRGTQIPGFTTVDLSDLNTDGIKADVSDLKMIETGSVGEIYASQILEHFPHVKTKDVLKEWHRVLRPGGKISIGVPDFARAIELFQKFGMTDYIVNLLYGDQIYDMAFHYAPFTFGRLASLLDSIGFRNIKRIVDMPYGIKDCSALICNADQKPVSLNVEAVK
jgi:ubiquinone/menaquinone biosynthesis C-methylase UbiE